MLSDFSHIAVCPGNHVDRFAIFVGAKFTGNATACALYANDSDAVCLHFYTGTRYRYRVAAAGNHSSGACTSNINILDCPASFARSLPFLNQSSLCKKKSAGNLYIKDAGRLN